jgi:hypothetical protein
MGSVGDAYDNAMAESFFATLECELIDRRSFRSHAEGRMAVFQYIEGWYNPWRRNTGLGYESPMSFERKYGHAATSRSEGPLSVLSARDSEASRKTTRQDRRSPSRPTSGYPCFRGRPRLSTRAPPAPSQGSPHSTPLHLRRSGSS